MKIFCIIGKYSEVPEREINWHMLPDSSVTRTDNPFFVPDFDSEFRLYPALAVRISRLGKSIAPKFAGRYYAEATAAATVRAQSLLSELRAKGLPWDKTVSFDRSCMLGDFQPIENICDAGQITFRLGNEIQEIPSERLRSDIDRIIAVVSGYNTLKMGDIILLTASETGLPLAPGQNLSAGTGSINLLEIRVK